MDLNAIKRKLEQKRCPKCNERPTIQVKRDKLEFSCCCDKFKNELINQFEKELGKQMEDQITNMFKKL